MNECRFSPRSMMIMLNIDELIGITEYLTL